MSKENMLTTVDNPYDPWTDFDAWLQYDTEHGYNSCELLARVATTSSELPIEFNKMLIEEAIDEIVFYNVSGMHTKAPKPEGLQSKERKAEDLPLVSQD